MGSPLTAEENATDATPSLLLLVPPKAAAEAKVPDPPKTNNNSSRNSLHMTMALSPTNMKVRKSGIEFRYTDSARDRQVAAWQQLVDQAQREDYEEGTERSDSSERVPLLPKVDMKRVQIAATFLRDYEKARVPVFRRARLIQGNSSVCRYCVSDTQLALYNIRFHWLWEFLRFGAVLLLFLASVFDRPGDFDYIHREEKLHSSCVLVSFFILLVELGIMKFLGKIPTSLLARANPNSSSSSLDDFAVQEANYRSSQQSIHHAQEIMLKFRGAANWANPVLLFAIAMTLDTVISVAFFKPRIIWIGIFKPLVLFYVYPQARDGLEALLKVLPDALCVIFMELFIIFMFSAMAVCLYGEFEEFEHIQISFISMFEREFPVNKLSLIYCCRALFSLF